MTVRRFIPAILWFLVTVVLLCLPGSAIPESSWLTALHADKCVHIALFFISCFLFARPVGQSGLSIAKRRNYFGLVLVAGIVYGTLMEFVQKYLIPNRSFEGADIIADSAGCIAAYLFSHWKFLGKGGKKIGPDGNRDRNQN